ncbi:MAG TPA: cellulose synthase operon protein YhjQ/BcsQ [Stellaceae bacterium]|nr:cellulose synthase operon protein YhjQ/BcsQ [Stellaceae bacterium]
MSALREEAAAPSAERVGVLAILQDEATLERVQGVIREQQLSDELIVESTLDAAMRRIHSGLAPRLLLLDISDTAAPIAEVSAARAVGGRDVKLVALGTVNDVTLFRDLISAGASDYLVKPASREAFATALSRPTHEAASAAEGGLGQIIVFLGSRGGVGTTTAAVSCAWLLAEERQATTALVDLDLHFGTVALKLDTDPGGGLCEALGQPSRIDSRFIDGAMVKVTDRLRVLAAEASVAEPLAVDPGAIDLLFHELRRKFAWIVVDLPRGASPIQRTVLAAASRTVLVCERSLPGLRDTIRLQTLLREQAPQTRVILAEAGASGERALIGKGEFEKGIGKSLDASFSYDPKSVGGATNAGQPLPVAAPRSPMLRDLRQLVSIIVGPMEGAPKRRLFALKSLW